MVTKAGLTAHILFTMFYNFSAKINMLKVYS